MGTDIATTTRQSLTERIGSRFGVEPAKLYKCLKSTAFKGKDQVSDEQMMALLIVADQYKLNPFTREIFAFPQNGGIVPVVGVDGWARIINEHPQFDGMEFEQDEESCTCAIYRKDRSHPTRITEYMAECKVKSGPWTSHPRRMLRHKTAIQCARLAFGYAGIYDQDEAERIVEGTAVEERPPVSMPVLAEGNKAAAEPPEDDTDVPEMTHLEELTYQCADIISEMPEDEGAQYKSALDGLTSEDEAQALLDSLKS